MSIPRSLFEIQLLNCYCVRAYKQIRDLVEAKSKRLTSLTFVDSRFTLINFEKLHFQYQDVQNVYKRLLVFGDCKIELKHFNVWVIIVFRQNGHQASFLGMFIKRTSKIDTLDQYALNELLEDMEYIFDTLESQYINTFIESIQHLKVDAWVK